MIVLLAVSAGAMNVQVIEGDADGAWDLSAKKTSGDGNRLFGGIGACSLFGECKQCCLLFNVWTGEAYHTDAKIWSEGTN